MGGALTLALVVAVSAPWIMAVQPDDPAFRAEIDGVGKQVIECHQQLFAVECARDRRRIGKHAQLARLYLKLPALHHIGQEFSQWQPPVAQAARLEGRGTESRPQPRRHGKRLHGSRVAVGQNC